MKTVELNLYNIKELSEESKSKAYQDWLGAFEYPYEEEIEDAIREMEILLNVVIKEWRLNGDSYEFILKSNSDNTACDYRLSGLRLRTWLLNNCNLWRKSRICSKNVERMLESKIQKRRITEIADDYTHDAIDVIWDFIDNPDTRNSNELINEVFNALFAACSRDYKHLESIESFEDEAELNEYFYTKDGKIWID